MISTGSKRPVIVPSGVTVTSATAVAEVIGVRRGHTKLPRL